MTNEEIDELFTYHAPTTNQVVRLGLIREKAKSFARLLVEHTPKSADQSAAIRKLRECVMTANASIVLETPEGGTSQ